MSEFDEEMAAMNETLLDIDTSDSQEPTTVEPGEYKIRITGFRKDNEGKVIRTSEAGNKFFITVFDIPDEEFSKGLSKMFMVPTPEMEPKRLNAVKWDLECFKRAFGLAEINFSNMVGKEGYAILGVSHSEQYGNQNEVKKFVTGA